MICRLWRGWATPDNADAYERIVSQEVLPSIAERDVPGYHGAYLMRRDGEAVRGAVTASGRFALVVAFDIAGAPPEFQVRTGKLHGSTLVDSGIGIDASSLAVAGRTAYWKHDGQARSVDLPE